MLYRIISSIISLFHGNISSIGNVVVEQDDDDDCVVFMGYDSELTDDQIKRARDLQLPDNFFIYENNKDSNCPGCLGCIDG